jgi:hypothetical protein
MQNHQVSKLGAWHRGSISDGNGMLMWAAHMYNLLLAAALMRVASHGTDGMAFRPSDFTFVTVGGPILVGMAAAWIAYGKKFGLPMGPWQRAAASLYFFAGPITFTLLCISIIGSKVPG